VHHQKSAQAEKEHHAKSSHSCGASPESRILGVTQDNEDSGHAPESIEQW